MSRFLPTLLFFFFTSSHAVLINEIRIDQPSSDNDEYFELVGAPSESLNGLTYLVIGDGSGGSGVIESVSSLNGLSLDANGFFIGAESTFTLGTADSTLTLGFENGDNVTHLLVSGFTGASGNDLDTNDDGVLDSEPWTAIVDSVSLIEEVDAGEQVYSQVSVGPNGIFVPGHVYRCGSAFFIGEFDTTEGTDSPGAINDLCVPRFNEIRIDQSGTDNDEYAEISGGANADLDGVTLLMIGDGAGGSGVIDEVTTFSSSNTFNPNGLFTVAESTFTLATQDLTTTLNFENSDNVTFLLVDGFTGAAGNDLDTDDDGIFDSTPWTTIFDSVALIESVGSGDLVYSDTQVGPNGTFVPGHVYLCPAPDLWLIGDFDLGVDDTPTTANICQAPVVAPTVLTIPEIQGSGAISPVDGTFVTTTGVVVGDFQGNDQLRGFYLQDTAGDNDASTSDGIFVFDPDGVDVNVGDSVTVTGSVDEVNENTQISDVTALVINSSGNPVTATVVTFPETSDGDLETVENMLIQIDQTMTVSQNFFLARYGQLTLSSPNDDGDPGRLFQPTNQFPAGSAEAIALLDENARRTLILDDGQDINRFGDNPDPVPFLGGPPATPLRAGDTISQLIGILENGRVDSGSTPGYRLHPTVAPVFIQTNPRTNSPEETDGGMKIASFNVLNYFNTIDDSGSICGPGMNQGCRGADSAAEFIRQQDKIFAALAAMDADVVGLVELENNGLGAGSAIQDLVSGLNALLGDSVYSVLPVAEGVTPGIGEDVIAVGYIYKPATINPIGTPAVLETGAFAPDIPDNGINRQPIAASFQHIGTGESVTLAVNHFKSKGSAPNPALGNGNDDQGDGQGAWNLRRTEAANELADWLATFPTGIEDADILVIGDINAYSQEDPLLAFEAKGFVNLVTMFEGDESYSFTFGGQAGLLDHALGSASVASKVKSVESWHINTDEPTIFDYNVEFKANIDPAPAGYYSPDAFRSSDHDPILITLTADQSFCWAVKSANAKVISLCL